MTMTQRQADPSSHALSRHCPFATGCQYQPVLGNSVDHARHVFRCHELSILALEPSKGQLWNRRFAGFLVAGIHLLEDVVKYANQPLERAYCGLRPMGHNVCQALVPDGGSQLCSNALYASPPYS